MGYFLINNNVLVSTAGANDILIQCDGKSDTCTVLSSLTATCASGDEIGTFKTDKKLCLDTTIASSVIGTSGSYLIKSGEASAFKSVVRGKTGVIKVTGNAIVLDSTKSFICVKEDDLTVTNRENASATCGDGKTKYTCNSLGVCEVGDEAPVVIKGKRLMACPSSCAGDGTAVSYCLSSDNKIHTSEADGTCQASVLDAGVHVFRIVDEKTNVMELTLGTSGLMRTDTEKLIMYQCNSDKICTQIEGYAKIDTYTLITEAANFSDARDFKTNGNDITFQAASGGEWAVNTYYSKEEGTLYKITTEGSQLIKSGGFVTCAAETDAGGINSEGHICLVGDDTSAVVSTTTTNYILSVPSGHQGVFESYAGQHIIVTKAANSVTVNKFYNAPGPFLINVTTMTTQNMDDDLSDTAAGQLALFNCGSNGLCKRTAGYAKASAKYYKIQSTPSSAEMAGNDYVTNCNSQADVGKLVTSTAYLCVGSSTSAGIEFPSAAAQYLIYDGSSGYKYLRAAQKIVTVEAVSSVSNRLNVLDGNLAEVVNIATANASAIEDRLKDLSLFYCGNNVCTRTYGYFNAYSKMYAIGAGTTGNSIVTIPAACAAIGGLVTGPKLCLATSGTEGKTMTANKEYVLTNLAATNIFTGGAVTNGDDYIIIMATSNSFTLEHRGIPHFFFSNHFLIQMIVVFVSKQMKYSLLLQHVLRKVEQK